MLLVNQVLGDTNHVVHVFRAAWIIIRSEDVQRIHVFVIGLDVLVHQRFPVATGFVRTLYDFVIDVGEILDIMNIVPAGFKPTMNQIKGEIASCMTKMASVVNGHAAHVHRHLARFKGGEVHLLSASCVVQANGHGPQFALRRVALEGSYRTRPSGGLWRRRPNSESS